MQLSSFEKALKQSVRGEVRFDALSKRIYSVDASIYEIPPIGIFLPHDTQDIQAALSIAREFHIPLIPRGAATGTTGGCIGNGLIIDTSKFMHQIEEINYEQGYALCQAGVVQDHLNAQLLEQGYRLGPDTSTGNRATIGGMIANNAAGSYSLRYGMMIDHILEAEIVLSDGSLLTLGDMQAHHWEAHLQKQSREGEIYKTAQYIHDHYKEEIQKNYPPLPRRSAGYRLDKLLHSPPNLAQLLCSSEGTLGIVTKAKLALSQIPQHPVMLLCFFDSLTQALETVTHLLKFSPLSLELIDETILKAAPHASWMHEKSAAVLIVEFDGFSAENSQKIARECQQSVNCKSVLFTSKKEREAVWKVRKAGLELLQSKRSYRRAVAFIEDLSIAPEKLAPFMAEFLPLLQNTAPFAGIYGHVGAGCIHIRPYLDLRNSIEVAAMEKLAHESVELVQRYQGAISGEHGEGIVRSWANNHLMSAKIMEAHRLLKDAFDPENLMNPGKILTAEKTLPTEQMRLSPQTEYREVSTFLDFSKEGGFALAVDLCNGNGLCRKKEGLMCPSFQATRDEYDTTRARAQALKEVIARNGRELSDAALQDVLALCLECKGCKTECPSQIDMAKMKAETLYQWQEKQGYSVRTRLFGHAPYINQLLSKCSSVSNFVNQTRVMQWLLEQVGITKERGLPLLNPLKIPSLKEYEHKAVLFKDTYSAYHCPEIYLSALSVMQGCATTPIAPPWSCCGRTYFSKGMLKQAKKAAEKLVALLYPYAQQGLWIVVLEPSCYAMLVDDYQGLLGGGARYAAVKAHTLLFEEWLLLEQRRLPAAYRERQAQISIHTHCHQKALKGEGLWQSVLALFPNVNYQVLATGCCGMAGSFGYEKEHYALSQKIGELALLPQVRASEGLVCANGFSCRHQIAQGSEKQGLHLAQILNKKIN